MKVTITIEGELTPKRIMQAVYDAYILGRMGDNELYRGHRQFDAFGCEMTYTCTEEQP